MSRYDHKIESCLEGIDHLSKQKSEMKETIIILLSMDLLHNIIFLVVLEL